ncbi:MAG: DUF4304 domain-containing protein [Bacteroidota bacterium]|nr:DUF4304 domain-containing protein [Bacteroidota bacterium]
MNSKEFKNIFNEIAHKYGFEKAFGSWFKETTECIAVLELQKSNFGDFYLMNIKIFIQGAFGKKYMKNKDLAKSSIGHINANKNQFDKDIFDFDQTIDDVNRKDKLENLFNEFIIPFTQKVLTKSGIKELAQQGKVFLLPAVEEELKNCNALHLLRCQRLE